MKKRKRIIETGITPEIVQPNDPWADHFNDADLDYPHGILTNQQVTEQLRALYTGVSNTNGLQIEMASTEAALQGYFESVGSDQRTIEAAQAVRGLFSYLEQLGKSTARKTVITYYLLGSLLNKVEAWSESKAQYMIWVRNNFSKERHIECLRQARKLVELGEYAIKFASLGKNRCLELVYLFRQHIQEENDRREHDEVPRLTPVEEQQRRIALEQRLIGPGFNLDSEQGEGDVDALRVHMDTVLTIHRMKQAGIDEQVFNSEQVKMLALYRGLALEKKHAHQLKAILDQKQSLSDKQLLFDEWLRNRMHLPGTGGELRPIRMRSILAYFPNWIDKQWKYQAHDIEMLQKNSADSIVAIKDAYKVVLYLANKLGIVDNLEQPTAAIEEVANRIEEDSPMPETGTV